MKNILLINGHRNIKESLANKAVIEQLKATYPSMVTHDLCNMYPDYNINSKQEQEALKKADIIILQFPFYWYSVPAILKKWIDDVFEFNFAFGPEGDKLEGKDFLISVTVGGPQESYQPLGYNHFTVDELLKPLEQLAYLSKMKFHTPIREHRMVYIPDVYNTEESVLKNATTQAAKVTKKIQSITEATQ